MQHLDPNEHAILTAHKTKIPTNEEISCFEYLRCCIYHAKCLTNIKLPGIVGILTFISRINFVISRAWEYDSRESIYF